MNYLVPALWLFVVMNLLGLGSALAHMGTGVFTWHFLGSAVAQLLALNLYAIKVHDAWPGLGREWDGRR